MNTSAWVDVHPSQILGSTCLLKEYDLHTVTLEEMKAVDVPFELKMLDAPGPTARRRLGRSAAGSTSRSRARARTRTRRTWS